jgi:hypothetical protein
MILSKASGYKSTLTKEINVILKLRATFILNIDYV